MSNSNLPPISEEQLSQLMDGEWDGLNPSRCVAGICNDDKLRSKWSRYHLIRDCMKSEPVSVNNQLLSNISAAIANEPAYTNITPFNLSCDVVDARHSDAADTNLLTDENATAVSSTTEKAVTQIVEDGFIPALSPALAPAPAPALAPAPSSAPRNTFWATGCKGFAVAASVAAVTVVGMNAWQGQNADALQRQNTSVAVNTLLPERGADAFSQQIDGAPLPRVDFVANTGSFWVSPQTAERVSNEERLNMFLSQHLENSPTASRVGLVSYSRLVGYVDQATEQ